MYHLLPSVLSFPYDRILFHHTVPHLLKEEIMSNNFLNSSKTITCISPQIL